MARSKKSAAKKKGGKKRGSVTIDMEGVESGGRTIADGWASARIVEAELTEAESSGNEMFKVVMECKNGKEKAKVWDNLVLTPNALWKLKSLLEAAGVDVPESEMELSADDLLDLEFDVEIVNELYEGKDRPRVATFAPAGSHSDEDGDDDSDDDEDEKPSKKSKRKSKDEDEDDDDEDEEDEDDDSDDDDDDSDDDDEDSDDEDDDDDDEDEDEPPKRRGKSKSKSKKSSDDDEDDEDDEDDDSDEDDDDDSDEDDEDEEDDDDEDEEEDEKPKKRSIRDKKGKSKSKLRAGMKVSFEHKGKEKQGVITSIDSDTVYVEDKKGADWELSEDEITVLKK